MRSGIRMASIALAALIFASWPFGDSRAGELVQNGGFEAGAFTGWVNGAGNTSGQYNSSWADHTVVLDCPFAGSYSALLGFKYTAQRANRFGYMYQDVSVPTNISQATLFFKFRQQGYDGLEYDPFRMQIRNTSNTVLATVITYAFSEWDDQFKDSGWLDDNNASPVGYDLTSYSGQTIRLYFRQDNLVDNLYRTWVFVDNVSVIYRKFADLAVDGNGNDVFGTTGSGAGGTSALSREPGQIATYMLDVENEGLDSDSYTLSVTPPSGWSVSLRYGGVLHTFPWTTPVIAAGSKIQVEVLVSVPAGQSTGGYSTILDAISPAHSNRYDSVRLTTNVVPAVYGADFAIDANGFGVIDASGGGGVSYREANPSTQVTYTVDLYNIGARADSFQIHFTAPSPLTAVMVDGGTIRTGQFKTQRIDPSASASYTLRVTVPASLLGGDYSSFVYVKSLTDTLKKDGVRAVTRVKAPKVDIVICGSGDNIIDATSSGLGGSATVAGMRGITVYFPLILQNEGGVADSFAISWTRPANGWTAVLIDDAVNHSLPWTTSSLAAFSEKSYVLAVTIASNASYDTYRSVLNAVSAVSSTVRESVAPIIAVATGNEVDLSIDGNGANVYGALGSGLGGSSIKTAAPGSTVSFAIVVENESGENLFDLSWNTPSGWLVSMGDSISSMRGVTALTYTLQVQIPSNCPGGTFDIIINGVKTNKKYFVDSVRGRLLVTAPHIVDALVDGNGDEVFGATGSGAGGSSLQSTIGGRTVHFTLELQNQGGQGESYAVTWNGFSGWSALLDGSASPHATASVAAGASLLCTFEVVIPAAASTGDYNFILDIASTSYPGNVESATARVHVNPPPRVDLVINGEGAQRTAPAGTGEGGRALVFGNLGSSVVARLDVVNRGGFPDSFRVSWREPDGWPANSTVISDGAGDRTSPFVTQLIDPGDSLTFTVKVSVFASAALRSRITIDGVGISSDLEDSATLEIATGSFVRGMVFDDRDHDRIQDGGEPGWTGVTVTLSDADGPISVQTDGSGACLFEVRANIARTIIESNQSGMISLSPDTVSCAAAAAGETLSVDFADVRGSMIEPSNDLSGPSGSFFDFPHQIVAGTSGQAALSVSLPAGWVEVFYRDGDADGKLGAADSLLRASDLALDPDFAGQDVVWIIVRVFVPPQVSAGTVASIALTLHQTLSGTSIQTETSVTDRLLVLAKASGLLKLLKEVDRSEASPGDELIYTITFANPGVQAVQEIEIIDPLSPSVEFVPDAFGSGRDVEWIVGGSPVYLTADPGDADEAMLDSAGGRLRVVLSRRAPFTLESGASGQIVYRVRIR
ncbi:MAG: NEW3 domain-containing protein [Candidatus Krumholzibacteria bacterium]|nr:NEW3 domain-containing protein [Candidatus Krumholzibacteria bacterium]